MMRLNMNTSDPELSRVLDLEARVTFPTVISLFEELRDDRSYKEANSLSELASMLEETTYHEDGYRSSSVEMLTQTLVYMTTSGRLVTVDKHEDDLFTVRAFFGKEGSVCLASTLLQTLLSGGVAYSYATRVGGLQRHLLIDRYWEEWAGKPILAVKLGDEFPHSALVYAEYAVLSLTEGECEKDECEWLVLSNSPLPLLRVNQWEETPTTLTGTKTVYLPALAPIVDSQYREMCWKGKWGVKMIPLDESVEAKILGKREALYRALSSAKFVEEISKDLFLDEDGVIIPLNDEVLGKGIVPVA